MTSLTKLYFRGYWQIFHHEASTLTHRRNNRFRADPYFYPISLTFHSSSRKEKSPTPHQGAIVQSHRRRRRQRSLVAQPRPESRYIKGRVITGAAGTRPYPPHPPIATIEGSASTMGQLRGGGASMASVCHLGNKELSKTRKNRGGSSTLF